jgi:ABC-2 type transport system permease protein
MNLVRVRAIVRKEVVQILRDSRSLAIVLVMPIMLLVLLGYGINLDQRNVPTCVLDRDASQQSEDLLKRFQSNRYFDITYAAPNYPLLVQAIDSGQCRLGLVIPENFSELIQAGGVVSVQGLVDATDDNAARLIFGYSQAVVAGYSSAVQIDFLQRNGVVAAPSALSVESRTWFNEDMASSNFIVPGVIVIVMSVVGTFLTALTIAREWERGTMEQLISTPVTALEVTIGKLVPYFVIGVIDTALCAAVAIYWFEVPFRGTVLMMFVASTLFLAVVLFIGFWISATTKSQLAASQFAMLLTFLPAFLLSGFAFPLEQTPILIQILSYLTPARYYVGLLKEIFLKGSSFAAMSPELLSLAIFAAIVGFLALRSFKKVLG